MELREGYKQTEVGILPENWKVLKLIEIGKFSKGSGIRKDEALSGDFPCVRYGEIYTKHDYYIKEFYSFISKQVSDTAKRLNKGDILFAGSGETKEEIGKCIAYLDTTEAYAGGDIVILSPVEDNPMFLGYILNAPFIQKQKASRGQGDAVVHISASQLGDVLIPLPPTKAEQTAIATALSDMDNLIAGLEKLIEKKKAIKQGAMQELLRPKEGWVEISLLQLADNKKELFDDGDWIEAEHISTEGIRLIQTGNIGIGCFEEKETKKYISDESFVKLKCKELQVGDLLICRLAEPAGRACVLPDIGERKIITSVDVTIFRPRVEIANRIFLANLFSTNEWFETVSGMSGGTTHKRISRGSLGRIKISIPLVEEQNMIAVILSDMDNEIQSLKSNLLKYNRLKQGMMQELLTGKIRLV